MWEYIYIFILNKDKYLNVKDLINYNKIIVEFNIDIVGWNSLLCQIDYFIYKHRKYLIILRK